MPIGKALLLKGLGGLAAIGGAIGGGYSLYDYYSNQETKFDRGLIDFLEADDSTNIQFSVKDGSDSDISTTFPTFTTGTNPLTATIKVSVNTATSGTVGTLTDKTDATEGSKAKKSYLQKLNGNGTDAGTAWTWVCEIKFTKKADDTTANELADKDKLVKESSEKGFFNKLKDTDTNSKHKELKIKFIKDCAAARGKDENRKINKLKTLTSDSNSSSEIKTTKIFELRKGNTASNEEATKLYPVDQSDFNYWFGITSN